MSSSDEKKILIKHYEKLDKATEIIINILNKFTVRERWVILNQVDRCSMVTECERILKNG